MGITLDEFNEIAEGLEALKSDIMDKIDQGIVKPLDGANVSNDETRDVMNGFFIPAKSHIGDLRVIAAADTFQSDPDTDVSIVDSADYILGTLEGLPKQFSNTPDSSDLRTKLETVINNSQPPF